MWKGMLDYWKSNGTDRDYQGRPDHWGQVLHDSPRNAYIEYFQGKTAPIGKDHMIIYEPCNYASNIAYYHGATKICDYGDQWSISEAK